jgi:hypothetical protein
VIVEPTDILENDLFSENSLYPTREKLDQLFVIWKKSHPHQTQPFNPNRIGKQSFNFKSNPKFDDFVLNLKQNKKLILSGHLSDKLKEISKIPPKIGSNCKPDKEDFYWQAMLEDEEIFAHHKPQRSFDESPKFTRDYLSQNPPEAPLLQPFYTTKEAVELSNEVVARP